MNKKIFSILCILIFTYAEIPIFDQSTMIESSGIPISVGTGLDAYNLGFASPCVIDWNEDGKKDLLIGQYESGKIRYYENVGENNDPTFDGFKYLEADGELIEMKWG